jgi:hypothetical protein
VGRGRAGWLGRKGGGRGWAKNQSWVKVQEIKSFQILFGISIFGKLCKFVQEDLEGILTWGFFLKSSRFSRNLRKMPNEMP